MKFIDSVVILGIILSGAFLRFYKLGEIPNGLYVDEASTGYNAYSLLLTGKDEYGKSYPVAMRFLGSYSPPIYTYLTSFVMSFLGLSVYSTRFISALAGVFGILIVYFYLRTLKEIRLRATTFLVPFLFAISPWAIFFSRAGYELNLGFIVNSLGVFFIWLSLKKRIYLILGFVLLSISIYTAHPQMYSTPLFLAVFLILFRKEILRIEERKFLIIGVILFLIIQIPNLATITTPAFYTKSSLFYSGVVSSQSEKIFLLPSIVSIPLSFLREFLSKLIAYYSPRNLFFLPDPDPQRFAPSLSVFYPWMVVPYLVGIYLLFKNIKMQESKFITLLLLVTPVPAALSPDPFSTQRALSLLLPAVIVIALGIDKILVKIPAITSFFLLSILISFSFLLLWRSYFVLLPKEGAKFWGWGVEQLSEEIKKREDEKFVIDQSRQKPTYISLAFYLQYPPEKFHQEIDRGVKDEYYINTRFNSEYSFGNIETRTISWEEDIYKEQILVGDELAISDQQAKEHFLTEVFEIRDPINQITFVGFRTNPVQKCRATNYFSLYCKEFK